MDRSQLKQIFCLGIFLVFVSLAEVAYFTDLLKASKTSVTWPSKRFQGANDPKWTTKRRLKQNNHFIAKGVHVIPSSSEKFQLFMNDHNIKKRHKKVDVVRKNTVDGNKNDLIENPDNLEKGSCEKIIQIVGQLKLKHDIGKHFCPEQNCTIRYVQSKNITNISRMDAVILHHKTGNWKWPDLIRLHLSSPIWIYLTQEPPVKADNAYQDGGSTVGYNLTMTYRHDSDIVFPYGRYIPGKPEIPPKINWAANKTKLIAWMASNCLNTFWKRADFVLALNATMHVDMYGSCGDIVCPRNNDCQNVLWDYKFYLALENCECEDYITEKFWEKSFMYNTVPIVYGTTRENYERLAPPSSFIHVNDFANFSALVDYVTYLDGNDTAYNEYLAWKTYGRVESYRERDFTEYPWLMCQILSQITELSRQITAKERTEPKIVDMNKWWRPTCQIVNRSRRNRTD
ncbi:putative glycoprotein 3-alpha-L-fucosyltransferase A-like [Apostichopus japonicus]|uniref:Fucosyltransferase n=1 Tax=Stichopus japonicus TaxID=307972 RepID=A0A2G8L702_STIJA|nr:putative glycoprotein 3-alpha-L-fucosyltransferase A-like [Apostichopus japonicus]